MNDSSGNEQETVLNDGQDKIEKDNTNLNVKDSKSIADTEDASEQDKEGTENEKEESKQGLIDQIKSFDLIGKLQSFDISETFSDVISWFRNFKFEFSWKTILVAGAVVLVIVVLIILKVVFEKSYVIRQKIANYRNRKRAQRQYIVIKDSRRTRRTRRRRH